MQRSDAENARRASRGQSRKVQSDASQTRRNTSPDMSAPLLLIVEDELAIQELIVFVCEAEGFRTTRAGSIAEARSALAAERPDLILLDRMLPDRPVKSGFESCAQTPRRPMCRSSFSRPAAMSRIVWRVWMPARTIMW